MTSPQDNWTTLDVELFHDEQLDADRVHAFRDDLRRDVTLRARLAAVRRLDEAVSAALLQPTRALTRQSGQRAFRCAAAACVAMFAAAIGWSWLSRPTSDFNVGHEVPQSSHRSVRVIFSLPLPAESRPSMEQGLTYASAQEEKFSLSRLSEALGAGRLEEAVDLLEAAPPAQRRLGYRYLGELLRSAQIAEEILDRLGSDEQVAVCGDWALEPAIRPVVFDRLRRLSENPSVADKLRSLVAELSTDPALRTWLQGYQLFDNS